MRVIVWVPPLNEEDICYKMTMRMTYMFSDSVPDDYYCPALCCRRFLNHMAWFDDNSLLIWVFQFVHIISGWITLFFVPKITIFTAKMSYFDFKKVVVLLVVFCNLFKPFIFPNYSVFLGIFRIKKKINLGNETEWEMMKYSRYLWGIIT